MSKAPSRKTSSKRTGIFVSGNFDLRGNVVTGKARDVSYKNIESHISKVGDAAQIAAGEHVQAAMMTPEQKQAEIARLIGEVKAQLACLEIPPDQKIVGDAMVQHLEGELVKQEGKPDPIVIQSSGNWLLKNIPALAGALTSLFVNPIIGKVVEAAGSIASDWVKEQFKKPKTQDQML